MELKFSRRVFLKSAAAAALAVSAAGLTACGSGDLVANANGLNDTAELREIKMTVRSLSYGYASDGTFYLVPEVLINNGTAAGIPIDPANGSFKLRVNGSKDLTMDSGTMAFLKKNKSWNAMEKRTLNRGQYEKGHLCGTGKDISFDYVQILFFPNPQDNKTYLSCKVYKKEANTIIITQ